MITPDQMAKKGTEHGIQAGLFIWVAVARQHGFVVANEWAESRMLPPFNASKSKPVDKLEWLHAVPNGGSRGDNAKSRAIRGAQMKAEGVRDGVADIFLPVSNQNYAGLYIEMKTPTGAIRKRQKDFRAFVLTQSYAFSYERSWRDAAKLIQAYIERPSQLTQLMKEK